MSDSDCWMDIPAGMDTSRISESCSVEQSRAANMINGLFPAARCHRVLSPGTGSWCNQSAVGSEAPRRSSPCETGYCPFQSVRWPIGRNHEQRFRRSWLYLRTSPSSPSPGCAGCGGGHRPSSRARRRPCAPASARPLECPRQIRYTEWQKGGAGRGG